VLRALQAGFRDAEQAANLDDFPPPRRKPPEAVKSSTTPTNKLNLATKAGSGTLRQFRRPRAGAMKRPQMALPYQDASWWVLAKLDSALVSNAEGTSAAWYRRDPRLFRSLARRSLVVHRRLRRRWPRLAAQYRAAAADFNSPERWRETFAASLNPPPDRP
jgi:galactofuranosylgalactofuranosylrhamnosyl-N-acetylglucosaminyl-diphospho-decaprenol beta-1,5/1,6-galactofuranosyltransferase